jgi:hypothetical protein
VEEDSNSLLIKLPERDALLLQPSTEISDQSDLLPAIVVAVTLARKQSGKAFDVRPQRANLQTVQFFGGGIKMNHHRVVPFMGWSCEVERHPNNAEW